MGNNRFIHQVCSIFASSLRNYKRAILEDEESSCISSLQWQCSFDLVNEMQLPRKGNEVIKLEMDEIGRWA